VAAASLAVGAFWADAARGWRARTATLRSDFPAWFLQGVAKMSV
jgi:hypothetical protein